MVGMTEMHGSAPGSPLASAAPQGAPRGLDVEDLRVFCEVVRLGSFTGAAGSLHYTQSGVSRRVASLERATGGALFARQPRGVRLTPAGAALHRHASDILAKLARASAEIGAIHRGTAGPLRIGSFSTANASLVPAALRRLRRERPRIEATVLEALTPALLERLHAGVLDVAVVSDYPTGVLPADGLDLTPLCDDRLLVALPKTHRLAGAPTLRLRDLAGECWIEAGLHGADTMLAVASARAGFAPRTEINVASWIAKQGFVAAGLGVTLVPSLAAGAVRNDLVLRPLDDDLARRRVFAALPTTSEPLPAAAHLIELLAAAAAGAARQ
jgi:DNA-binding transcriptional LysR family regulator